MTKKRDLPVWEPYPHHVDVSTRLGIQHNNVLARQMTFYKFSSRRKIFEAFIRILDDPENEYLQVLMKKESELVKSLNG